jgi:hypothetical protein
MACCVCIAALFGALAMMKALLTFTPRGQLAAQEWRLPGREGERG